MKREYPDRPTVGVGAVIVQSGRVLLVRRSTEPLKGQWSVPGGVLELGETLRAGVAREALEETGLVVQVEEVMDVFDGIYRDPDGRTRYHYVLIDFICKVSGGELRAGSDAAEIRWFTRDELNQLPSCEISDATRSLLLKALEKTATN
jgi:ADP-ribose pyrophosphatase YjhB (NUDIX family)